MYIRLIFTTAMLATVFLTGIANGAILNHATAWAAQHEFGSIPNDIKQNEILTPTYAFADFDWLVDGGVNTSRSQASVGIGADGALHSRMAVNSYDTGMQYYLASGSGARTHWVDEFIPDNSVSEVLFVFSFEAFVSVPGTDNQPGVIQTGASGLYFFEEFSQVGWDSLSLESIDGGTNIRGTHTLRANVIGGIATLDWWSQMSISGTGTIQGLHTNTLQVVTDSQGNEITGTFASGALPATLVTNPVPEPSSLAIFGIGACCIGAFRRCKQQPAVAS